MKKEGIPLEKFVIKGGHKLTGEVSISGSKNAVLPILAASVLAEGVCVIDNIPTSLSDVSYMLEALRKLGAGVELINENTVRIDTTEISSTYVDYEITGHLRASYYFIGSLLGRKGHAKVALPGGCNLGPRPIDQHIKGFQALGAKVSGADPSCVDVSSKSLFGSSVYFDVVSVGATINVMIAASKAVGTTIIENVAKEPHIVDVANFLNSMGADIRGAGTDTIKVNGVSKMHGCSYTVIPDQIEAGTFMVAAAATKGDVLVNNVIPKHLESITAKLIESGADVEVFDDSVRVSMTDRSDICTIKTAPHPGFPTDMQPLMAVLLSTSKGTSLISESIWSNRFKYVEQLQRMGAVINVDGNLAIIHGVKKLLGTQVRADDLRAGAAMVVAGLCAEGTTEIEEIHFIDRGYENLVSKLRSLGADITRVEY